MISNEEVDRNYKRYGEESVPANEEKLKAYDPVNIDWKNLKY